MTGDQQSGAMNERPAAERGGRALQGDSHRADGQPGSRPGSHGAESADAQNYSGTPHAGEGPMTLVIPDKPKRLLIADDEHLMASGVASSVKSLGYEVVGPVSDGRAAIHTAETELPDMCLLDIEMPEMDGLVAANEIWSNMGIPAILISAYSQQEYIDRAMETGVFAYLLKPVNADDLRVAIGIAWTRARQHDVLARRVRQLERTMDNRKVIEQAKWVIVRANGFDESTAHTLLQRYARTTRQKLHEVAAAIITSQLDPATIQPRGNHKG